MPNFLIWKVDPDGKVHLNEGDLIFTGPNQHKIICFFNTRSYWSQAYNPVTNSLYVPWVDACLDMQTKLMPACARCAMALARPGGNLP